MRYLSYIKSYIKLLIPIFVLISVVLGLELVFFFQGWIYGVIFVFGLIIFASVSYLIIPVLNSVAEIGLVNFKDKSALYIKTARLDHLLRFLFPPLIFLWSGLLLSLFFEGRFSLHLFAIGIGLYLFLFLKNLESFSAPQPLSLTEPASPSYTKQEIPYQPALGRETLTVKLGKTGRISRLMDVVSVFFLSSSFYGLVILLQAPHWQLAVILGVISIILIFTSLSWPLFPLFAQARLHFAPQNVGGQAVGSVGDTQNTIFLKQRMTAAFLIGLMMFELFAAGLLLPISFYVRGVIMSTAYYVFGGLLYHQQLGSFETSFSLPKSKVLIKRYLYTAALILLVVLATARWI